MFLFFPLIQDTCPFFEECVVFGAASQHVTSHLLLMPFQIGLLNLGPTNWTPQPAIKCEHLHYTKFEESGGMSTLRQCSEAECTPRHPLPFNVIALVDCHKSLKRKEG